ncbi:MAG: thioredoxin family protein [Candidatus Spyradocola sp.]|jgi:small redox-active disulfide protein 2
MDLFRFIKKKEEPKPACCGCASESATVEPGGIQVLGGGCAKCHALEKNTKEALASLGLSDEVHLVTDYAVIAARGVLSTPALVVDEKVVSTGRVLRPEEIASILRRERGL